MTTVLLGSMLRSCLLVVGVCFILSVHLHSGVEARAAKRPDEIESDSDISDSNQSVQSVPDSKVSDESSPIKTTGHKVSKQTKEKSHKHTTLSRVNSQAMTKKEKAQGKENRLSAKDSKDEARVQKKKKGDKTKEVSSDKVKNGGRNGPMSGGQDGTQMPFPSWLPFPVIPWDNPWGTPVDKKKKKKKKSKKQPKKQPKKKGNHTVRDNIPTEADVVEKAKRSTLEALDRLREQVVQTGRKQVQKQKRSSEDEEEGARSEETEDWINSQLEEFQQVPGIEKAASFRSQSASVVPLRDDRENIGLSSLDMTVAAAPAIDEDNGDDVMQEDEGDEMAAQRDATEPQKVDAFLLRKKKEAGEEKDAAKEERDVVKRDISVGEDGNEDKSSAKNAIMNDAIMNDIMIINAASEIGHLRGRRQEDSEKEERRVTMVKRNAEEQEEIEYEEEEGEEEENEKRREEAVSDGEKAVHLFTRAIEGKKLANN